ncbi:MAG: ferredoxin--NADP reductase, partial [Candidatus Paceibacterota bacterium]
GLGSEYLKSLNEGDEVFWKGPAGVFVLHSLDRDKVFITTGTGIAPVRSMIASAILESTDSNPSYTLFWGQRTAEDAYFKDEFEAIAHKHSNFAYTICLSRERELKKGEVCVKGRVNSYVTEYLRKRSDLLGRVEFYLCGSKSIVDSLKTFLEGLQVPTKNIYFEKFV